MFLYLPKMLLFQDCTFHYCSLERIWLRILIMTNKYIYDKTGTRKKSLDNQGMDNRGLTVYGACNGYYTVPEFFSIANSDLISYHCAIFQEILEHIELPVKKNSIDWREIFIR